MNEQILSLWVLKPVFSLSFLPAFFCLSSFSLLSLVSASRHPSLTFFLGLAVGQRPSSFPKGTGLGRLRTGRWYTWRLLSAFVLGIWAASLSSRRSLSA